MHGRSRRTPPRHAALLACALLGAACREAMPEAPRRRAAATAATAVETPRPTAIAPLAGAIIVVPPAPEPLPYAMLPIEGSDAILAVSQAAGGAPTLAQRFDGATRTLGPAFQTGNAFVAAAFATGDGDMRLVETAGISLGVDVVDGAGRSKQAVWQQHAEYAATPGSHGVAPADVIVKVGTRLLALSLGPPPEEDEDDASPDKARPGPRKDARPKAPKPKKRGKKDSTRRKSPPKHDEATSPARRVLTLWGYWVGERVDDRLGDPFDTGVRVEEPMAGLGIVGAGARTMRDGTTRIDVVFYEWAGEHGVADKSIGRARFGSVGLDGEGSFVEGTRGKLDEGDLFFGFLAPSLEPRLATFDRGSVLLSQAAQRGPCQATLVTPSRAPVGVSKLPCALDPARIIDAAEERRRPSGDPDVGARASAFDATATDLLARGAHRAEWQQPWDGPLAVLGPTRGFTQLADGSLRSFDRKTFEAREEPRPLVASRARAYAASFAADGDALVRTHAGLRVVRADGTIEAHPDPLPPGPARDDERYVAPSPFAKIGASWWTARGAPRRLVPPATSARSPGSTKHPQAAVLVGGDPAGMLIELDGDALAVSSLDAAGGLRVLSRVRSPIVPPVDAVAREGGGALVVGPRRDAAGRLAVLVIGDDGAVRAGAADLDAAAHGPVPRLLAMPGRGAVVLPREAAGAAYIPGVASRAVWLDERGDAVSAVDLRWPDLPSLDGVPMQTGVPDLQPGAVREIPLLHDPLVSVVGVPGVDRAGAMRFVVSHRMGSQASVELLRIDPTSPFAAPSATTLASAPLTTAATASRCPPEMVLVDRRFCVDRWETAVAEGATGRLASPDYPVTPNLFAAVLGDWAMRRERVGHAFARAFPLPRPEPFQMNGVAQPTSVSRAGILPSGYLTGLVAKEVCAAAGKRLCKKEEFRTACRGEKKTRFPYGDAYQDGACNVGHAKHPAAILHGHASLGHLDPRLGRVPLEDAAPGLRPTGATPTCASRWEGDAIYDMVGNLDEWIDEKGGAFAGGFYARGTKSGCDAIVDNHPASYLDYSTGVRCCRDADAR